MGNFLSKLFSKEKEAQQVSQQVPKQVQVSQKTQVKPLQTTKQSQQKKQEKTLVPTTKTAKDIVEEKVMSEEEKAVLEFCANGYIELSTIAEELVKADISTEQALNWYVKSLDYVSCDTCTDLVSKIEELYTKFIVLKLKEAVEESTRNRESVIKTLNLDKLNEAASLEAAENGSIEVTKPTIQNLTGAKIKIQSGYDKINEILTSVPSTNRIASSESRAYLTVDGFALYLVDDEFAIINNLISQINNLLSNTFKNKKIQQVKKFFEMILIGSKYKKAEYYDRDNSVNNPGNEALSEVISLEGYKQLLQFAPFQPLLLFHDASTNNNPLFTTNNKITDNYICSYLGIDKITTVITETPAGVEIEDGIDGTGSLITKRSFKLDNNKNIIGTDIKTRKDVFGQNTYYFNTKANFAIDLGVYNNQCHTVYYSLNDSDTYSIMQTYSIEGNNYVLMCESNTWYNQTTQEEVPSDMAAYFNAPTTAKTFIAQTDIIIHKETISNNSFKVTIDFETKNSDVKNFKSKQYLINLLAFYSDIVFGNGGLDRDTFCDKIGLTNFMNADTKSLDAVFTQGTTILQEIWKNYPTHLLSLCAYANKSLPNTNCRLPVNYPRFKLSDEAAAKIIMNKIINYTNLVDNLETVSKDSNRKIYFKTVDLTNYPYSLDKWDIKNYPLSENSSSIYTFKVLSGTTNDYDNRFDFLFTQVPTQDQQQAETYTLNIVADEIIKEFTLSDLNISAKPNTWNISDVLNDQSLSMQLYSKYILAALRWQMILPFNTLNSTIFINSNDLHNGCPEDNLLAFLMTPRVIDGKIYDPLFGQQSKEKFDVIKSFFKK